MRNMKSNRAKKYPGAALAMRGIQVVEQMPDRDRPKRPGTAWPAYYELFDQAYAMFDDGPTAPPAPSPDEIDSAMEWVSWAASLWAVGRNRREWRAFYLFARGASVLAIKDRVYPSFSTQKVHHVLDRLFHEVEVAANLSVLGVGMGMNRDGPLFTFAAGGPNG